MYSMDVFVGIDIGGSHISLGFLDSTHKLLSSSSVPITHLLTPPDLVLIISSLCEKREKNWVVRSVGVGCPGQTKRGVIVAASNLPNFQNFPLVEALKPTFGSVPILLMNDADAAICAEVWGCNTGLYAPYKNVAMITLGTGVGCGLILNHQLYQGSNGLIEAGHMIVNSGEPGNRESGTLCGCGQRGCVETYSSASSTARRLREADGTVPGSPTPSGALDGAELDGLAALARYAQQDPLAVGVLEVTAHYLAVLCVNICRVVDPDVIVFAGGLAKSDSLLPLIKTHLDGLTWTILPTNVTLLTAQSIQHGGVVGAALAAKRLITQNAKEQKEKAQREAEAQAKGGVHLLEGDVETFLGISGESGEPGNGKGEPGNVLKPALSEVEKSFLARSGHQGFYSTEHIPAIEVTNIYELGKLVSQRFIEWVRLNPTGVVALPTGRTPEFFIKTLEKYKTHWATAEVQGELLAGGVGGVGGGFPDFPDTSGLHFAMLDEFFPMPSSHRNSFCRYIRTYYLPLLGISPQNILTFDLVAEGVLTSEELASFDQPDVDIALLDRAPKDDNEVKQKILLEKVKAYCALYEKRLSGWGGIGFFLGGIGPDGHVAFNQQGQELGSVTRLTKFNYPSAAQAAGDLGGIEMARGKAALTIGLSTITANAHATIIIMAAGEGKAKIVQRALEGSQDPDRPASALHGHPGARFYISHGAAGLLTARKALRMASTSTERAVQWALQHCACLTYPGGAPPSLATPPSDYTLLEAYLYEQSVRLQVPVHELTPPLLTSLTTTIGCPKALQDPLACCALVACAARRLREKIEAGLASSEQTNKSFLHTAPHHDDIMLSYHGAMHMLLGRGGDYYTEMRNALSGELEVAGDTAPKRPRAASTADCSHTLGEAVGGNVNHFAYLTSGFHSVNESFIQAQCEAVMRPVLTSTFLTSASPTSTFLTCAVSGGELTRDYDEVMCRFFRAFFSRDHARMDEIEHVIFLRKVAEVWSVSPTLPYTQLAEALVERVRWLLEEYLPHHQPGDSIPKDIQILKGMMRETEVDRVWAASKMPMNRVHHLRSKFYTDDFFTPMPSIAEDAMPMANLLKQRQPHVLSVAFDPEGTGPDTHYKVLLVVAAGLRVALERGDLSDVMVWGYRNVWFEFTPSDTTLMIPVSSADLDLMHDTFMACFTTQKEASFPSPYHDGPFSSCAQNIQKSQHSLLKTLLGEEYFNTHLNSRIRDSAGFVFIKAMYASQFLHEVEVLKTQIENK